VAERQLGIDQQKRDLPWQQLGVSENRVNIPNEIAI